MNHGWEKKRFDDCITKVKCPPKLQTKDYEDKGLYKIVSQEDGLINGYTNNVSVIFKHKNPVVVFGDHTRCVKYVDFDFALGADGIKILSPIDDILPKFFAYTIRSFKIPSLGYARHYRLLRNSNVPIPSKEQQQAIVAELDALNEAMEVKRKQLKALDALAQALFYDTFGDPRTNPKSFPIHGLSDLCKTVSTGITYKPEMVAGDGTIVLRSSNIQDSKFVLDDIVRVQMPLKASQYVQKNDILMCSRNGSARLVGKVCLIPEQSENISWGAFMTIIRSDYYNFLFHYFKLPAFREQLRKTKTSTVNQITIGMLKRIRIPLPPLALQERFAAQVEEIEREKENVEATIARLQTLLDSRMDYWFND